ncbi:MAG: hypothetical protein AB7D05_09490 [Mangrovibacterium sp.]
MKKLKEEILTSYKKRAEEYQQRLKENEELVSEVQKTLDQFRKSHLEMADNLHAGAVTLHNNLNKGETDRLNAFGNLMSGIRELISAVQKEVHDIQQSTVSLLGSFSESRGRMAEELKEEFAQAHAGRQKQEEDRLKDFDLLKKNIQDEINRSKNDVRKIIADTDNLLKKYADKHMQMSKDMRNDLNANLEERVNYTRTLLKAFHDRLTEIGKENFEMARTLRKELMQSRQSLSENDRKRLDEFDQSMGEIRHRVAEIQASIAGLLNNLEQNRIQAAGEWQDLSAAIARIKNSFTSPAPKTATATVTDQKQAPAGKKEEKEKTPAVTDMHYPDDEKTEKGEELNPDIPKEKNLDEKILMYVNAHPGGVKVSEMEEPLGEQRMRIGYICKKLLEEGKITKLDRAYFPTAKNGKME